MICKFTTEQIENGLYRHTCEVCGTIIVNLLSDTTKFGVPCGPKITPPKPNSYPRLNAVSSMTPEQRAERDRLAAEKRAKDEADALAGAEQLGDVSLLQKGAHYVQALIKWKRAGFPTRTPGAAATREAICRTNNCKLFDAEQVSCKKCGCQVGAARWAIFSKTKMATETCPKRLWE